MTKRTKTETAIADPMPNPPKVATGKIAILLGLLQQPGGTTVEAMMAATGWQAHSVRGAVSGSISTRAFHAPASRCGPSSKRRLVIQPGFSPPPVHWAARA